MVQKLVLPARIFEIKEKADLGLIGWKLKDFREEELYKMEKGETVNLVTEILDLKPKEGGGIRSFQQGFRAETFLQTRAS